MDQLQEIKDHAYKLGQKQLLYELGNAVGGLTCRADYNTVMQFIVHKFGILRGDSLHEINKSMGQFINYPSRLSAKELELLRDCKIMYDNNQIHNTSNQEGDNPKVV